MVLVAVPVEVDVTGAPTLSAGVVDLSAGAGLRLIVPLVVVAGVFVTGAEGGAAFGTVVVAGVEASSA